MIYSGYAPTSSVLRNTFLLLALTLLPTIAGAFVGVQIGFVVTGWLGFIAVLIGLMVMVSLIQVTSDSSLGVMLLLALTFFMGMLLAPQLVHTLQFKNGVELIALSIGGTALISIAMATYAMTTKTDFSGMGKYLFIALIVLIIAGIASFFLPGLIVLYSAAAMVIFSLYIVYDVQQIVNGGETNYIRAALGLYLDVFNIFSNLLNLAGIGFGDD
jgi:modulator of FtsH protease